MLKRPTHYRTTTRDQLSERQLTVLAMIADGKTNPEIADALGITLDGAKFHVREILGKLGVESREEAAAIYRQERRPMTRAGSFLRGALSFGWLKPVGALAAVGGIALGSMAVTIALTQGGDGNSEPAAQDAGGPGIGALATPTREDPGTAGGPPACDEASVEWRGETRRNEDGSVRLDIYARSVGAAAPCTLDADINLTPTYSASLSQSSFASFAPSVRDRFTDEIGGDWSPLYVTSSTNVCAPAAVTRILLEWRAPSGQTVGSTFIVETPSCVDPTASPTFTALWWRLLSSTLPRMTPVPTPTPLPTSQPVTLAQRCGNSDCPDAAQFEQSPDFSWFDEQPNGFLDACGPATTCAKVYVIDDNGRTAVTVPEFVALLAEVKANAILVRAIGDSGKGVIDVVFSTRTGDVSIALARVNGEWRASGLKRWPTLPTHAALDEASFGSAMYYHVAIRIP